MWVKKIKEVDWLEIFAIIFITSLLTFIQAFVLVKLVFLVVFIAFLSIKILQKKRFRIPVMIGIFYFIIFMLGGVWALVGLVHHSNFTEGVTDAVRLYMVWSCAFVILYSGIKMINSIRIFHYSFVLAGILISIINLIGLFDQVQNWNIIPEFVRTELDLGIGLHDGYIQITTQNIGSLFLITPYLLVLQFRKDAKYLNSKFVKISLLLTLIVTVLSGRRALWLAVAFVPCITYLMSIVSNSVDLIKNNIRKLIAFYVLMLLICIGGLAMMPIPFKDVGFAQRLQEAFSQEDERTIQGRYLLQGFRSSPLMGSGFGAYAGYLRSEDRPWTYELTYQKIIFNMGIVGSTILSILILIYYVKIISILRKIQIGSAIPFCLVIAFSSILIGAYSNPYFGSFDYLFFVGLLPFLSSFTKGFPP